MSDNGVPFARLVELAGAVEGEFVVSNFKLYGVSDDSRQVGKGDLFVCSPSKRRDTHDFLTAAKERGASGALVHSLDGLERARALNLAALFVSDTGTRFHSTVSVISREVLGFPDKKLRKLAVTGTNGKSTTAWMVRDCLESLGRKAAYIGTLGYRDGSTNLVLENTSPFPVTFWNLLMKASDAGCSFVVTEASSHSLFEGRMYGLKFDGAVFTNLTQDHLDFHKTMESYAEAKKKLFTQYVRTSSTAAFSGADTWSADFAREAPCRSFTYGTPGSDLQIDPVKVELAELLLRFQWKGQSSEVKVPVGGGFNVLNTGSALAGLLALNISFEDACHSLCAITPVPGRFEAVPNDKGFGVIVDYAHTPDALDHLLDSVRALKPSRIATVFGCGGDRDATKRPLMARVASTKSDYTVATSDNPRTEGPGKILDGVAQGISPTATWIRIEDRKAAIRHAIEWAKPGDVVVIAGKGHEDYQIIGTTKTHFDDREVAREALS